MNEKYWQKVSKAYAEIMEAKGNDDFQRWLKASKTYLEFDYDAYQSDEYASYQFPMSFDDWAFERWIANEEWNEKE
jgi:hypothetical protein